MVFDPEDQVNFGPHCRNCHKGASDCQVCHSSAGASAITAAGIPAPVKGWARQTWTTDTAVAAQNVPNIAGWGNPVNLVSTNPAAGFTDTGNGGSTYRVYADGVGTIFGTPVPGVTPAPTGSYLRTFSLYKTTLDSAINDGTGAANGLVDWSAGGIFKYERTVDYTGNDTIWGTSLNWRTSTNAINSTQVAAFCSNDGFSWPHRTLGWKMLKDDLFGVDFVGNPVAVGVTRTIPAVGGTVAQKYVNFLGVSHLNKPAHDLDSVCLDCHNPTIWNATSSKHVDTTTTATDNLNDELLLRGLP